MLTLFPDGTGYLEARLGRLRRQLAPERRPGLEDSLTGREEDVLRLLRGTLVTPRDQPAAVRVAEHGQDPRPGHLPQARHVHRHEAVQRGRDIGVL